MACVQHPLSCQLLPSHEQQRQRQQCGGGTNCSHKRLHGSAPTGTHNMVQAHNYLKDVGPVDEFLADLHVLVVDDDPIYLIILERMLHQCSYHSPLLCQSLLLMCPYSRAKIHVLNLMVRELMCIEHNKISMISIN
jgi:hypothetical protein